MTDQQKKAVEEAATYHTYDEFYLERENVKRLISKSFLLGSQEVIDNPSKYGLGTWPVLADKLEILTEENARLREALQYLMEGVRGLPSLTAIAGTLVDHYDKAQEVLKGVETK